MEPVSMSGSFVYPATIAWSEKKDLLILFRDTPHVAGCVAAKVLGLRGRLR
jgi:hypothetical protein